MSFYPVPLPGGTYMGIKYDSSSCYHVMHYEFTLVHIKMHSHVMISRTTATPEALKTRLRFVIEQGILYFISI